MYTYRVILKDNDPVQIEQVSRVEKTISDNVVFYDESDNLIGLFEMRNILGLYRYLQMYKVDGMGNWNG